MVEVNLTPELRFPVFNGFWKEKKMGESFYNIREKGNDSLPIYSVSQKHGLVSRESLDRNIQKDAKAELNLSVSPDDLVYNMMRMWQGAIGLASSPCMVSPAYIVLRPKENENSIFYLYLFSKKRSLYLFWAYSYGLTNDRLRLYFKDFSSIKRVVPSFPEQQKIASFLTAIEDRIQLLEKKKATLNNYKKGVMQKLFSQEIRFKDQNGNDFPDWEKKKLKDVFTSQKGTGLSKNVLDLNGQFECILYGELYTTYAEVIFDIVNKTNAEGGTLSRIGDLLVPSSTTTTAIDLANVTALNRENVRLGGDITILRSCKRVNNIFYAYYLSNFKRLEISKYGQGTTIVHLYFNHFKVMPIDIPSVEEQNKIAAFLTAIDLSIIKIAEEIENTATYKKGLLQKMFV